MWNLILIHKMIDFTKSLILTLLSLAITLGQSQYNYDYQVCIYFEVFRETKNFPFSIKKQTEIMEEEGKMFSGDNL